MKKVLIGILFLGIIIPGLSKLTSVGSSFPTNAPIKFSSPTLVDVDNDTTTLEIVVGDQSGYVYCFKHDGTKLWEYSIRNFLGEELTNTPVQSSVSVADIDGDKSLEVVVTLCDRDNASLQHGA